jgi:hypothetical protein
VPISDVHDALQIPFASKQAGAASILAFAFGVAEESYRICNRYHRAGIASRLELDRVKSLYKAWAAAGLWRRRGGCLNPLRLRSKPAVEANGAAVLES